MEVRGFIEQRLLVNRVVDPEEVRPRLPAGLRPHTTDSGVVVGCCLLRFRQVRPKPLPGFLGLGFQAVAHRFSVEWETQSGATAVGVYVPLRHTGSRAVSFIGGRLFPGVHERAEIRRVRSDGLIDWTVETRGADRSFDIAVRARICRGSEPVDLCGQVAGACVNASVGFSPARDARGRGLRPGPAGGIEGVRMIPRLREAHEVTVEALESPFLAAFASARPAPSYLMEDVEVAWTRAPLPAQSRSAAPA